MFFQNRVVVLFVSAAAEHKLGLPMSNFVREQETFSYFSLKTPFSLTVIIERSDSLKSYLCITVCTQSLGDISSF